MEVEYRSMKQLYTKLQSIYKVRQPVGIHVDGKMADVDRRFHYR
jgi:hypothetical protein